MSIPKLMVVAALSASILLAACSAPTNAPAAANSPKPGGSVATSPPAPTVQATPSSGTGSGEALVNSRCTVCHSTDRIKAAKKSPDEWRSTVQRMVGKGAQLNPAEVDVVVKYLSYNYK